MDPYVVEGERVLPPPESWRYVSVPALELTRGKKVILAQGYEVLSNLTEQNTKLFVEELQLRQLAGTLLWPMIVQALPHQPLVVIVDRTKQAWAQGSTPDALAWQNDPITASASAKITGFDSWASHTGTQIVTAQQGFSAIDPLADPTQQEIFSSRIDPNTATQDPNSQTPNNPGTPEQDPFKSRGLKPLPAGFTRILASNGIVAAQINADVPLADVEDRPSEEQLAADLSRRAAEFALASLAQKPPLWFDSGMGWLIASTQVTPTRITFADTKGMLENNTAMPSLAQLLTKIEPLTNEEELLAAAFTHYGLYGDNNKHAAQFMSFVQRQSAGAVTPAQFEEIFGMTIGKMENVLATYARTFAAYKSHELSGDLPPMPTFSVREATQSEVARLQADSLITQGKPDLALNVLRVAYWRGEREPAMLALLAKLEEKQGSIDRARKITQGLLALKSPPASVYLIHAKLLFADATTKKTPQEKLSTAETRSIMEPLGQALQAEHGSEELFEFLATVVMRSRGHPHESIASLLSQASKHYPKNDPIREAADFAKSQPASIAPTTTP